MKKEPIVTIAIPAYKRPKELIECVESIVNQEEFKKKKSFNILVMDDSPDHEGMLVMERYIREFPQNIKYFWNKVNLGFERNILKLIKNVRTEYIFLITDDDKLKKNSLGKVLRVIHSHNPDLIASSYLNRYVDGSSKIYSLFDKSSIIDKNDLRAKSKIFSDSHILSGKIFKKSQLNLGGYVKHIGSFYPHMYLVGECLLKSTTYYFAEPLVVHRVGNKVYWNYLDDYMVVAQARMINDLSLLDSQFANLSRRNLLKDFAYIFYINIRKPKKIFIFLKKVVKTSDLLHRPNDWLEVIWGGFNIVINKLVYN